MYNHVMTLNSPTWTANGKRGGAFDFVATTQYISVADSPLFTLTGNYTVAVWINPDDIADAYKGIMGTRNG